MSDENGEQKEKRNIANHIDNIRSKLKEIKDKDVGETEIDLNLSTDGLCHKAHARIKNLQNIINSLRELPYKTKKTKTEIDKDGNKTTTETIEWHGGYTLAIIIGILGLILFMFFYF